MTPGIKKQCRLYTFQIKFIRNLQIHITETLCHMLQWQRSPVDLPQPFSRLTHHREEHVHNHQL